MSAEVCAITGAMSGNSGHTARVAGCSKSSGSGVLTSGIIASERYGLSEESADSSDDVSLPHAIQSKLCTGTRVSAA